MLCGSFPHPLSPSLEAWFLLNLALKMLPFFGEHSRGGPILSYTKISQGVFVNRHDAERHIQAREKKVIIAASTQSEDIPTYVMGVNARNYSHEVHTNVIR